jgi:acetylornithine deacetylase
MSASPARSGDADLYANLQALLPRYVQNLQDLIRLPSLIGAETPAQQHVAALATAAGLQVDLWDVDPAALAADPDYAPVDGGDGIRPNVTAVLPGNGGGRSLMISGHIDVVSPEPRHRWQHDPWGGQVSDGRMYGRGTLDMKGGLVAGLYAIHAVRETYGALAGDLVFESVIEEECSGNGTLAARRRGPRVDAAIIPEVSGEDVQIANPGVLWFEVTVTGKPAYVGLAGASVNAIEVANDVVAALKLLPAELNEQFAHPAYEAYEHPLTINVGTIAGGDWPSNVPLECTVGFRLSYPLQWSVAQGQEFVTSRLEAFSRAHPWLREQPPALRWHGFRAHGFSIDPDEPIVALLTSTIQQETGAPARLSPMFGTADARYFADEQIPAVYYGPAGGNMHAPDEWVELDSFARVARVLARSIVEWCA